MKRILRSSILANAVLLCAAGPAVSSEVVRVGDARFQKKMQIATGEIELKGAGVARFARLFKLCAAAFYGPAGVDGERVHGSDLPRRLEIEYFVRVPKTRFVELARKAFDRQLGDEERNAFQGRIDALNRLYRDVEPGDRYALTYHPDRGLSLELNGRELGRVEGSDFANAYFGIWLGDPPLSESLRRQLIGTS